MRYAVDLIVPRRFWQRPILVTRVPVNCGGVLVPPGFPTDGATTPRILWPIIHPIGRWWPAAVVHDYCLHCGMPRSDADAIFLKSLRECGVWPVIALAMYGGVRFFSLIKGFSRGGRG